MIEGTNCSTDAHPRHEGATAYCEERNNRSEAWAVLDLFRQGGLAKQIQMCFKGLAKQIQFCFKQCAKYEMND